MVVQWPSVLDGCNCVLFSENVLPSVSVSPCHRLYFAAVWPKYKRAHAEDRWHFKQKIDVREEVAFCVSRAHNTSYNPRTSRPRCSSLSSRRSTKSSSFKSVLYYQELNSWTLKLSRCPVTSSRCLHQPQGTTPCKGFFMNVECWPKVHRERVVFTESNVG